MPRTTGSGWTKVATPYAGSLVGTGLPFFQGLDVSDTGRVDAGWQVITARDPGTFGTGNADDGWKLLNLGLVHQSNGRSLPQSRGWSRLYAQGGWEWGRGWEGRARNRKGEG